ncbi:hypothetical protein HU200_003279 [Digitaria exilis]|uniref:Uncharacterized protein n=1 Tax=Digitaria exilis TaxID=1010633 RepID=A0A835KYD5_9POAL|nr:hypothetical protein HU200_003279 [Digitaria exilis]
MKLAVPGRVGLGGGEVESPRSRMLRRTLLLVLFLVRACRGARATVTVNVSQIGGMLDGAFHKYHGMFARLEPNQEDAASNGSSTNIHLRFLNKWKPPIYTDKDITDENNAAIKVALFEGDKKITAGPLSNAEIEILVLCGSFYKKSQDNWTEEEFDKHIVQGRDEQRLVLGTVRLTNGEVELSQIRFKEGSCRKKISMAARFCKSKQILQMKKKGKFWSKMIGHARKRTLEDRHELKAYQTEDGTVTLFFNCVHDLIGAKFGDNYIACEQFGIDHKALVKRLKEHVYNRLEDIPCDYVMKGHAPERISIGTSPAAGPSAVSLDPRQPNSTTDNLEAYEGYQAQGIAPSCQQQTTLPSIGPNWQQNTQVLMDYPDLFEWNIMMQSFSEASASAQLNPEPHNNLPQPDEMGLVASPPWPQSSFPEQDQGAGYSEFPGSGHGHDW